MPAPVVEGVGDKGDGGNDADVKSEKRHGTPGVFLPAVLGDGIAQVLQGKGRGCSKLHGVGLWQQSSVWSTLATATQCDGNTRWVAMCIRVHPGKLRYSINTPATTKRLRCPDGQQPRRTSPLGIRGILVTSRASGTIATLLTMLLRVGVCGKLGCMLEDARAATTRTRCARLAVAAQVGLIASMLSRGYEPAMGLAGRSRVLDSRADALPPRV